MANRFLFRRWVYILEFFDLLGTDGRPSATKTMSFGISNAVLFTAIYRTIVIPSAEIWSWQMFWLIFLCCAVMFGRWGFDRFITAIQNKNMPS